MNALVVDDSKPVRSILVRFLTDLGFKCHEAADGQEALDHLKRIPRPDLVTINLQMPVLDGWELIRRLRRDPLSRETHLLVVSSEQDRSRIDEALQAGAGGFLAKPFTAAAIAEKLMQMGVCRAEAVAAKTPQRSPIRVLIVDDSAVIRSVVAATLSADPELRVIGTAADGQIGLTRIRESPPDVVLLDVEMPVMDGLSMLRELRRVQPRLPVIMFSTLTERGARAAVEALVAGANDYVAKPKGTNPEEVAERIRAELIPKIKQFAPRQATPGATPATAVPARLPRAPRSDQVAAVVVAVSTGGPVALAEFLPAFVGRQPAPVLIVQHMPAQFTAHLAESLGRTCGVPVCEARHGQIVAAGDVLLAPGGVHMQVVRTAAGVAIALTNEPPEHSCRPAADVLFRSAARVWGAGTLGVVLTGMGRDGLTGSEAIVAAGGTVVAQDELTSVVWGMPGHVARAGLAEAVLPLKQLGVEVGLRLKRRGG